MTRKAPQPDLVDLHVHSTASDGMFAPREVVRRAADMGLKAVALTDHDTVQGVPEALAAGEEFDIEAITGVEISAEYADGACHILGYFIDPAEEGLVAILEAAREARDRRNDEILARLRDVGVELTMDDLTAGRGCTSITRAHFATALVAKGLVADWEEAFDTYLGRGQPAFVPRRRMEPEEAISVIRGAGGLASLAHPRQLNRSLAETEAWIKRLAEAGVEAVEASTPDHTANFAKHYGEIAERLGLVCTGGTDWHGREDSPVQLGLGRGQMAVHYTVVEQMKARLAARGK